MGLMGRRSRPSPATSLPPPVPPFLHADTCGADAGQQQTHMQVPLPSTEQQEECRQHHAYKSLPKSIRQRLVAADATLLSRTVHLRFLPTTMRQGELATLCAACGVYTRVRLCGSSAGGTQHWVYGFVEFAERQGAVAMLQRSGMELPNGAGVPPLRLMCTAAKQAIVDRVFHDADVAAGIACIFGTGNFAHRTLKEAVDSYHNLKRKEKAARSDSGGGSSSNNSSKNGASGYHIPAPRHTVERLSDGRLITELDPHEREQEEQHRELNHPHSYSNFCYYHKQTSLTPSLPVPHPFQQQQQAQQQLFMGHHSVSTSNSDDESAGITTLLHVSTTNTNPALTNESACNITPIFSHQSAVQTHMMGNYSREAGNDEMLSFHEEDISPPLKLPYTSLSVGVSGVSLSSSSSSSTAITTASHMYLLDRARALVSTAMGCAQRYITTGEQFYEAIGALRTLLTLVDQQVYGMGSVLDVSTVTHGEEIVRKQQVIQLRLLAHLLMFMLYARKGNREEALAAIHRVVTCCNTIPCTHLQRPTPFPLVSAVPLWSSSSAPGGQGELSHHDKEAPTVMPDAAVSVVENGLVSPFAQDSTAMEGSQEGEDVLCMCNPLCQSFDFLSAVDLNEEDEQEAAVLNAAMGILPTDDQEDINDNMQRLKEAQQLQERVYQSNVHLHTYVLNVLLTIGLTMETTHPIVTRSVYVLILRRAKEVFGVVLHLFEHMLLEGGVHHLRETLFPQLTDTKFLTLFFGSFDVQAVAGDMFWAMLPPQHMIRFFQATGCMM